MGLALLARGVLPSIGHSEADSEAVRAAIPCGYRHVTHLYSAMSTIVRKAGFRHAGIVESAYLYDELSSEIIADGCHLPAPLLQLAYRHIGPQRLVLVTDAMRGAGQTQGESILGSLENGQRVILEDGVAKMPDRTAFAGSICTADRLVRTMVTLAGASLPDAVRMITETPARVLGLSDFYGRVEAGRAADLAVFDHTVRIAMVFKDGAVCFENREEAFQ
ncbi:MAG: amidohydrolase family protein [Ruthenibacterium lactatiformans]